MTGDFSAKLDEILKNPAMLSQIKALADTMTEGKAPPPPPPPEEPIPQKEPEPAIPAALPMLFSPSPSLEKNLVHTRALLLALKPFLDDKRCAKIDKMLSMMRLAELAGRFGTML